MPPQTYDENLAFQMLVVDALLRNIVGSQSITKCPVQLLTGTDRRPNVGQIGNRRVKMNKENIQTDAYLTARAHTIKA